MNRLLPLLLALLSPFLPSFLWAQERYSWQDFVDELTTDQEVAEEADWTLFLEEVKALHEQPLNINAATTTQLRSLPFLTEAQVEQIEAYIYLHGALQTLGELKLIPLLDEATCRYLSLFVYAGEENKKKSFRGIGKPEGSVSTRTDIPLYYRRGYQVSKGYRGDPLYQRIKLSIKDNRHLETNVNIEKDPGERFYDAYGANVSLRDMGFLRLAIAGDYRVAFGEGLVMGGARQYGKSTVNVKPLGGLRPMTSTDEIHFLRGIAATFALGSHVEMTAFGSWRKMDATLNSSGEVQTLLSSGYHRTASEMKSRRDVKVGIAGGNIQWRQKGFHLGLTGTYQYFSRQLNPGTQLYRRYYPTGSHFGVVGLNYGYERYHLSLAGETAYSSVHSGWGTLHRLSWNINRRYRLSALQRYYDRRYHSFQASAFGQSSTVQNESGVMVSFQAQPLDHWQFLCYADFFNSPWPRYRMTHSSSGQEMMGQLTWQPFHRHSLMLRYQMKRKEVADEMEPHHRLKGQWDAVLGRKETWTLKSTIQLHQVLGHQGWGWQETVRYNSPADQWRLTLMAGYFHTDDYLSRIYLYEPSLWNSVSSASFFGKGLHSVLTARWTSKDKHWMLEGRYALTYYSDREEQGSGLQTIYSPWKNDLSFQVRWRF